MLKAFLTAAISASMLLTACGGDSNNSANTDPSDQSPATEQIQGKSLVMNVDLVRLQGSGLTADKVAVTVSKGEFSETLEISHEDYSATAEFSNLLVGDYQIQVRVFDGDTLVAEGTTSATVTAKQVAVADMRLELKAGGLVVNVCAPGETPETLWSDQSLFTVQNDLSIGFAGELTAGGEPEYHSSLPYASIQKDDVLTVDLAIDQIFEQVSEEHYQAISDHHSLTIKNNGEEVLTLSGCNSEVSLKTVQPFNVFNQQGMYGSNLNGERIELRVKVPVTGFDYLAQGDLIFGKDFNSTEPYYRPITEVSYVILFAENLVFSSVSAEELTQAQDLASLFANPDLIHEAYIETTGFDEPFSPITILDTQVGGISPAPFVLVPVTEETSE